MQSMRGDLQASDDPVLLETMIEELRKEPAAYQPTNCRAFHERRFLPELRKMGLRNFRRHRSVQDSFGAAHLASEWMYINALLGENCRSEWRPSRGGTRTPVTAKPYEETLSPTDTCVATYETDYFLMMRGL